VTAADQIKPEEAPRPEPVRVQMTGSELELYVREGRPTGFLLYAVAQLKGMSVQAVAKASGMPEKLVASIFAGHGVTSVKLGAILRLTAVIGIDPKRMRFAAGQVHIFRLDNLPRMSADRRYEIVRAAGLLMRSARVVEVHVQQGLLARLRQQRFFVALAENVRCVFVADRKRPFKLEQVVSAQWAKQTADRSTLALNNVELIKNLRAADLTEGEFDELFQGDRALSWEDVHAASRVNGVSKADLMAYIQSRAAELDETDFAEAKRVANENRQPLRLVENEQRVACG
jgi:hypothetical protein